MKQLNRNTTQLPSTRPVKILQFGEGNFLRAFVDWVVDILNEKTNFNGNVFLVQPIENGIIDLINQQDGLYHVLLNGISGGKEVQENRLITSIVGGMDPHKDYQSFLNLAENPDLEFIVSNTTEAGIVFNESDKGIEKLPSGFPGKVTALLYYRFRYFNGAKDKGLTLIPCELIDKNGDTLKQMVLKYTAHFNLPQEFVKWIQECNYFCNTLVDRIVPGYPRENINAIQNALGYEDKLVVKAEPFHLWVIEGTEHIEQAFPTEQTALEVKFVKDLAPYRTRKVRILNGAHTALVPVAYLNGLRTVREATEDATTGKFLREVIFEEIVPTLDLSAEELDKFANDVIERFQNPFIRHELTSIALNSISKYKVRVLPSVLEFIKRKDRLPENLLHSLAALIVFYRGNWNGEIIPLNDSLEVMSFFKKAWEKKHIKEVVNAILSNTEFWDIDLSQIDGLPKLIEANIETLLLKEQVKQVKTA